MKIINPAGDIIIPGVVPTGNLAWVDAVNGNDSLAVRGRLGVPFKTLVAAKNAAAAGDTVIVFPGTYSEQGLAKDGVNWHFMTGAVVLGSGATSIFNATFAMGFKVTGKGRFDHQGTSYVLEVGNSGNIILFECHEMYATKTSIKITNSTKVVVEADSIASDELSSIEISAGTLHVKSRVISSETLYALNITGGTIDVEAYRIYSNVTKALYFTAGTAVVTAVEIYSNTTEAVEYNSSYSNALTVRHARVASKVTPTSGNYKAAIMITAGSGGLRVAGCVFFAADNGAASLKSIDTTLGTTTIVRLYGMSVAKHGVHANVSVDPTRFITDANLV